MLLLQSEYRKNLSPFYLTDYVFSNKWRVDNIALIAVVKGENIESRAFSPILLTRYCAEMLGLVAMIMGLTKVPLSVVGTVTQAYQFWLLLAQ